MVVPSKRLSARTSHRGVSGAVRGMARAAFGEGLRHQVPRRAAHCGAAQCALALAGSRTGMVLMPVFASGTGIVMVRTPCWY